MEIVQNVKKSAAEFCQILRMITIVEIVIKSTPAGMTLDPAVMHCPAWDDSFGY